MSDTLAGFVVRAGAFFAISAIVLVPRGAPHATGSSVGFLLAGVVLAVVCVGLVWMATRNEAFGRATSRLSRVPLAAVMIVGICLQVALALLLHPVQASDSGAYLGLARLLANGETYRTADGLIAFFPPGLPFFLTPFVAMLGSDLPVVLAANIVLYVATAVALFVLCNALFGRSTGLLGVLLLTIWPSRLLISTVASKETLTLTLVTISLALAVGIEAKSPARLNALRAVGLGVVLGLSALTQPGLMLLFLIFPVAFFYRWSTLGMRQFFRLLAIAMAALVVVTAPWILRNYRMFDGAFTGISTNGGSVFYRANNDLATAEFSPRGTIDLSSLPELEANTTGFRLGKEWILANPAKEAELAARKLAALLDNDGQGAYWAIWRRHGASHEESRKALTTIETFALSIAIGASYLFWIFLCASAAVRCLGTRRNEVSLVASMLYPFLYCCAIFSIFESGARQHIFAVSALIVLAASHRHDDMRFRGRVAADAAT